MRVSGGLPFAYVRYISIVDVAGRAYIIALAAPVRPVPVVRYAIGLVLLLVLLVNSPMGGSEVDAEIVNKSLFMRLVARTVVSSISSWWRAAARCEGRIKERTEIL